MKHALNESIRRNRLATDCAKQNRLKRKLLFWRVYTAAMTALLIIQSINYTLECRP